MVGTAIVVAVLAAALAGDREAFSTALGAAPLAVLLGAAALQLVALVSRCEAWNVSVRAAGGTMARRQVYWASAVGNLGSLLNTNLGAAGRIALLRRTAPDKAPRVGALVTAEVPIVTVEALLAVLTSFTLVGPLGLPWWLPLLAFGGAALLTTGLGALAGKHRRGFWSGLAVLRSVRGRNRLLAFVLIAVAAQIARNWLMLHAVGVDASLFDAIAVLICMVTLSQLPLGPSVGAAAVVLILGANGVAATAAAGVLLTVTGTAGALAFATWAAADRVWRIRRPTVLPLPLLPRPVAFAVPLEERSS
ncbi:MAG TPA: hypothetical protein VK631_08990 [Solirubrobacteraceae bacterium]|nr:hypothetical protein [Solirubrobacteraceae bacterium]